MTSQIASSPARTSSADRHDSSFASMTWLIARASFVQISSSRSPVVNGYFTGVVSATTRSAARRRPVDDEAAADRVVRRGVELGPVRGERRARHAVRVRGQAAPPVEDDVLVGVEVDDRTAQGLLTAEPEPVRRPDLLDVAVRRERVDGLGVVPGEAEDHRLRAAVAVPGRAERAVQLDPHPGHVVEEALGPKPLDEEDGRPHRADRVGARRSDPDREQVEDRQGHGLPTLRPALTPGNAGPHHLVELSPVPSPGGLVRSFGAIFRMRHPRTLPHRPACGARGAGSRRRAWAGRRPRGGPSAGAPACGSGSCPRAPWPRSRTARRRAG